jgi:hypothetical protein
VVINSVFAVLLLLLLLVAVLVVLLLQGVLASRRTLLSWCCSWQTPPSRASSRGSTLWPMEASQSA